MKKRMYKIMALAMTAAMVVPMAAQTTAFAADDKEITYWNIAVESPDKDIVTAAVDKFNKETKSGYTVNQVAIQNDTYKEKLVIAMSSGECPDMYSSWSGGPMYEYIDSGFAQPIDDLLDQSDVKDKLLDAAIEQGSYNGHVYAIPYLNVSLAGIFYNKDMFKEKHIPYPNKNWTFADFLTTAQKLTDKNTFGISFEEDPLFYLPYLMSNGGGILPTEINKKESQESLQYYADLRKKYHVAPLKSESASATMAQMFIQKRLGMYLSGRWMVPKLREEADFDWDITQFPNGTEGSVVQLDASGWAIAKSSKHKAEAKKLIEFLSSKESSEKFTQSGLIVPARIDSANSKYFLDGQKPENTKLFLDIIKTSKPTPVTVDYREITDKLQKDCEKLFN